MVSILIPIYNEFVGDLTRSLLDQLEELNLPFEILLVDDASREEFKQENRRIAKWSKRIYYQELAENKGRSAIRNFLFEKAQFDFCIVLDCDSELVDERFIQNFLEHKDAPVIYGGRTYRKQPPEQAAKFLRWKYGIKREQVAVEVRRENPYRFFLTNNFAVRKEVIQKIKFDLNLTGYGHEDTLFSRELEHHQIPILHIDNPVNHIGLENTDAFLGKTKNALRNLLQLYQAGRVQADSIPLLKAFEKLKNWQLIDAWLKIGKVFLPFWKRNLNSANPWLLNFDLYRLYWLCKLASTSR